MGRDISILMPIPITGLPSNTFPLLWLKIFFTFPAPWASKAREGILFWNAGKPNFPFFQRISKLPPLSGPRRASEGGNGTPEPKDPHPRE
jgi:hypothetical protein